MKVFKSVWKLLLLIAFALVPAEWGFAQSTGSIVGTVTDNAAAAVPDVNITLVNTATGDTRTSRSGGTGDYQFLQILPGFYRVTVEGAGFKQFVRTNVEVTVNNATRIDAMMQIGTVAETVEVTSASPLLSTQTSSLNYEVGEKQIDNLPLNGRNVMNLTALVPGVVPQGNTSGNASTLNVNGWGNYQIGGGAANQSQTFIDGAPINISYTNSTSLVPTQDVVQEFQVATNNVSPEFGRFAGGVINIATKPGTNDFHGTAYEYYRNAALNANLYFNKHFASPASFIARPTFTQHQFGLAGGGPIIKNKTFAFLSWEEFSLRNAAPFTTTVPTNQMLAGDFSQVCTVAGGTFNGGLCSVASRQIYDPVTNTAFANNQVPTTRQNGTALALQKILFPAATNQAAITNNYIVNVPRTTVYNQYTARVDHQLNAKNQLFARFTNWHKNASGSSNLFNSIGNNATFATDQAVLGDSFILTPNLVGQARLSYLRFHNQSIPFLCCSFQESQLGGNWAAYQGSIRFAQAPQPANPRVNNFSTGATILDTDNAYVISGSLTYTIGRHTIQFGGESRRIEWGYVQSNSPNGTFTFDGTRTASAAGVGGFSYASYLLGLPTAGSAQEPAQSLGTMYYSGAFVADSYRITKKLTINMGLRWEVPGSFHERNGSLTTLNLTEANPLLPGTTGALDLVDSSRRGSRNWQDMHYKLFSPRVGVAYSPDANTVLRAGFGISYLPNTVAFSLGPYNNPPNSAITQMNVQNSDLSNPFPSGILQPPGHNQAAIDALIGQGIQSPLANTPYPYSEQYNFGVQRQFGQGLVLDVGYVGTHGVHLPLYSINHDQLPNQYNSLGAALLTTKVPNPYYAAISAKSPSSVLAQPMISQGYLLKPAPQYLYETEDSPNIGGTTYEALQVRLQQRFKSAGVLLVSYTKAHLAGTADTLTGYLETSRFGVGGASGVQDNNNINGNATNPGEYSVSSFDVPNRAVISYTLNLPFGRGHRLLGSANGLVDRLIGGYTLNGIFTFQSGFPLAFQDASANTLETNFAAGNAGPGLPAGVSRPNFTPNGTLTAGSVSYSCNNNKNVDGAPKTKLTRYFNTACFQAVNGIVNGVNLSYTYGNEPRVDPDLRAQGINNFDLSLAKKVAFSERIGFEIRAESFNLFNRTQFAPPNAQPDSTAYGTVTSQVNQPRLLQLSGRVNF